MLNEPDVSYHGVVYTEALGPAAYIGRARVVPLRNMGSAISPFNSFLILQGIETLPVRMDRHCENAVAVAEYLKDHPRWNGCAMPACRTARTIRWCSKYMDGGKASSILSFGIKGSSAAAARPAPGFIDALKLAVRLVNIGDAKTLACHPATTTHRQLGPRRSWPPPVCPRTWCGCPSASSTSTTSSPISTRRWQRSTWAKDSPGPPCCFPGCRGERCWCQLGIDFYADPDGSTRPQAAPGFTQLCAGLKIVLQITEFAALLSVNLQLEQFFHL
jgi:hypothetical protein